MITKNKGFTLIELLGTIVIVGILSTIAIVSIMKLKQNAEEKFNNTQAKIFLVAGQTYFTDNKKLLPTIPLEIKTVNYGKLKTDKYITKLVNSKNQEYDEDSYVQVQRTMDGKYTYAIKLILNTKSVYSTIKNVESQNKVIVFGTPTSFSNKQDNKYYAINKQILQYQLL